MHAPIAVFIMMVGGIYFPDSDTTTIPLKDELSKGPNSQGNSTQDMEWRERAKNAVLPRVPTLADANEGPDYNPYRKDSPNYPRSAYDPNANRRPQSIPQSPTEGGNFGTQNPWQTGQGAAPRAPAQVGGAGGYSTPTSAGPGGNSFNPSGFSNAVSAGNGNYSAPRAQGVATPQTASNYISSNNGSQYGRQYGLPNLSGGGGDPNKAFSNYQPPSGNSPWNNLYLSTNNGTTNPYTAFVRPAMEQQTFNAHISEQINGVQTIQRYQGTPAYEMPVSSGGGLTNPAATIDYSVH